MRGSSLKQPLLAVRQYLKTVCRKFGTLCEMLFVVQAFKVSYLALAKQVTLHVPWFSFLSFLAMAGSALVQSLAVEQHSRTPC